MSAEEEQRRLAGLATDLPKATAPPPTAAGSAGSQGVVAIPHPGDAPGTPIFPPPPYQPGSVMDLATRAGTRHAVLDIFLRALGATTATPPCVFTNIQQDVLTQAIDGLMLGGAALSIIDDASCHTFVELVHEDFKPPDPPPQQIVVPQPQQQFPPAPGIPNLPVPRMVAHNVVVNQADPMFSVPLPPEQHVVCLRRYEALFGPGRRPPAAQEPTE